MPTLVLPPQAGHASSIVDYGPGQSQMRTLRDAGLDNIFAIDWLPATVEQVAYLGSSVQYRVRTPGGLIVAVLANKQGSRYERGDDVELAWAPSEALVLDERADRKEEQP